MLTWYHNESIFIIKCLSEGWGVVKSTNGVGSAFSMYSLPGFLIAFNNTQHLILICIYIRQTKDFNPSNILSPARLLKSLLTFFTHSKKFVIFKYRYQKLEQPQPLFLAQIKMVS